MVVAVKLTTGGNMRWRKNQKIPENNNECQFVLSGRTLPASIFQLAVDLFYVELVIVSQVLTTKVTNCKNTLRGFFM